MNITSNQADALADFLLTLRPAWSKRYVVAALRNAYAINPDVEQLTRVAVRCALTAKIIKPDVIGMRGDHWRAQADERAEPPRPPGRCGCGDWHQPTTPCGEGNPVTAEQVAEWIGYARTQVAERRRVR